MKGMIVMERFKKLLNDIQEGSSDLSCGDLYSSDEKNEIANKLVKDENEIINLYKLALLRIEFLELQLSNEYGNLEDDYFISESKKYLKDLKV